jgi:hypothetical protein
VILKHISINSMVTDPLTKPIVRWLVLKSAFLSRFYIIILHLKYQ